MAESSGHLWDLGGFYRKKLRIPNFSTSKVAVPGATENEGIFSSAARSPYSHRLQINNRFLPQHPPPRIL